VPICWRGRSLVTRNAAAPDRAVDSTRSSASSSPIPRTAALGVVIWASLRNHGRACCTVPGARRSWKQGFLTRPAPGHRECAQRARGRLQELSTHRRKASRTMPTTRRRSAIWASRRVTCRSSSRETIAATGAPSSSTGARLCFWATSWTRLTQWASSSVISSDSVLAVRTVALAKRPLAVKPHCNGTRTIDTPSRLPGTSTQRQGNRDLATGNGLLRGVASQGLDLGNQLEHPARHRSPPRRGGYAPGASGAWLTALGSQTVKVAPAPGSLWTVIRPRICASRSATVRPSPAPSKGRVSPS
jgi:hypothetical protein